MALKPTLGYEQQLYVSTQQTCEPGFVDLAAPNSGVYTANVADAALLLANPQQLMAVLENDVDMDTANVVLVVQGTDQNGAPLSGVATFQAPAYSQMSQRVFPKAWAVEVIPPVDGSKFATITAAALSVTNAAKAVGLRIALFGVPDLSTFTKIGCKVSMGYDLKVPVPHAIQCGRDMSAFIKPGEIPVGAMEITAKVPTFSDGLTRVNGRRVTGLIKEIKEDKLDTMHIFLTGLILTSKASIGESTDPETLSATALYEDVGVIVAR